MINSIAAGICVLVFLFAVVLGFSLGEDSKEKNILNKCEKYNLIIEDKYALICQVKRPN